MDTPDDRLDSESSVGPLRRATIDDLPVLLELAAEYCIADGHIFHEATTRAAFAPLLHSSPPDRHGTVWVILDESRNDIGYAVVTWGWSIEGGGLEALLDEIFVHTQGRGLGSAAMPVIEAHCRRHGASRIFLETERANDRARRLYGRLGFVEDDSIWMSKSL